MRRSPGADWLDRLACRSAGTAAPTPPADEPRPSSDERFSRASVLKLMLAGVASLSLLSLWRASEGRAECRDAFCHCVNACFDINKPPQDAADQKCFEMYPITEFSSDPWARWHRNIEPTAWEWVTQLTHKMLRWSCLDRALDDYLRHVRRCEDGCRKACVAAGNCAPPPAEPIKPPPVPDAPSGANMPADPCMGCTGYCCAPCPGYNYGSCLTVSVVDGKPYGNCDCK